MRHKISAIAAGLGLALADAKATEFVQVRVTDAACNAAQSLSCDAQAQCPVGTVVWGGGVVMLRGKILASYPLDSRTWNVTISPARFEQGSAAVASFQAMAICAPQPAGYELVHSTFSVCSNATTSCTTGVMCGVGKVAIAGGGEALQGILQSVVPGALEWGIDWYKDTEDYGPAALAMARAHAICANATPDGYSVVHTPIGAACQPSTDACYLSADCPVGSASYAGGFAGQRAKFASMDLHRRTAQSGWYPASAQYPGQTGLGTTYAVCATGTMVTDRIFADAFDP